MLRLVALSIVLLAVGCNEYNCYEITLEPKPEGLERTLSGWREKPYNPHNPPSNEPNTPLPESIAKRLMGMYPERVSAEGELRLKLRGTFTGKLPGDLGGSGTYDVAHSPLGASYIYYERVRGEVNLDASLYDRRAAADRFCDLVVQWIDKEFGDVAEHAQVRKFFQQDFREDVRNLVMLLALYAEEPAGSDDFDKLASCPAAMRVYGYLIERGYLGAHEMPGVFGNADERLTKIWLKKIVARKCGLSENRVAELTARFDAPGAFEQSWLEFLKSTPEYAQLCNRPDLKAGDGASREPDPSQVMQSLFELTSQDVVAALFRKVRDVVRVTLKLPQAPYEANGAVDGTVVSWDFRTRESGGEGKICFATWTTPNEAFQTTHFGNVAFRDMELAQFAGLFATLGEPQRKEFAAHLESLEPGDALKGRVQDFAFVGAADDTAKATAKRLVELLASQL